MNAACKPSSEPVPASAAVILVVEDDVMVRALAADYLRGCGYEIVEAGGADEAIRILQADRRIGIVFSDVNMPGSMDGFGLARWLRRERPALKLILTSGTVADLDVHGPVLAKPYDYGDLARRIRALLAG